MKPALTFKNQMIFGEVMRVYSQKITKKHQKYYFWCHFKYVNTF